MKPIRNKEPYKSFFDKYTASEATVQTYCGDVALYVEWCESNKFDPLTISKEDCIKYPKYLMAKGNMDSTTSRRAAILKSMYQEFKYMEIIKNDPTLGFKRGLKFKKSPKHLRGLRHEEREHLMSSLKFDSFHNWRCSLVVLIMYQTGMRRNEARKLKWDDIRYEDRAIDVVGKGSKPLVKSMSSVLIEKLKAYHELPEVKAVNGVYVFPGPLKGPVSRITIYDWTKEVGKWSGLGDRIGGFSCHTMRRSFCQKLIDKKTPLLLTQKLMGHSSPNTTQVYFDLSQSEVNEAYDKAME